jgi:hypothetical protein
MRDSTPNAALSKHFGGDDDIDIGDTPRKFGKFGNPDETPPTGRHRPADNEKQQLPTTTNSNISSVSHRMDVNDFMKAADLDDILIQVIFKKTRFKMLHLFHEAEIQSRNFLLEELREDEEEDERDEVDTVADTSDTTGEGRQSRRESRRESGRNFRISSTAGGAGEEEGSSSFKRKHRMSSKDITASMIEEELKIVLNNVKQQHETSRPAFPIANAVGKLAAVLSDCPSFFFSYFFLSFFLCYFLGRATLSAAMGLAAKVAIGTQALMEATYENFESEEASQSSKSRGASVTSPSLSPAALVNTTNGNSATKQRASIKGVTALAGVDSDDEV